MRMDEEDGNEIRSEAPVCCGCAPCFVFLKSPKELKSFFTGSPRTCKSSKKQQSQREEVVEIPKRSTYVEYQQEALKERLEVDTTQTEVEKEEADLTALALSPKARTPKESTPTFVDIPLDETTCCGRMAVEGEISQVPQDVSRAIMSFWKEHISKDESSTTSLQARVPPGLVQLDTSRCENCERNSASSPMSGTFREETQDLIRRIDEKLSPNTAKTKGEETHEEREGMEEKEEIEEYPWMEIKDSRSGRMYYYNKVTKKSIWSKPTDFDQRSIEAAKEERRRGSVDWIEAKDEQGRIYYYDKTTMESRWDRPATLSLPDSAAKLKSRRNKKELCVKTDSDSLETNSVLQQQQEEEESKDAEESQHKSHHRSGLVSPTSKARASKLKKKLVEKTSHTAKTARSSVNKLAIVAHDTKASFQKRIGHMCSTGSGDKNGVQNFEPLQEDVTTTIQKH